MLAEENFVQNRFNKSVPEALAISGLAAELLEILPSEARREYLAAYSRARRLALMGALQEARERRNKRIS